MRRSFFIILACFCFKFIFCQGQADNGPVERMRFLMDTIVRISVYDSTLPKKEIEAVVNRSFDIMEEIEARTSIHVDTSEVSRLISAAGQQTIGVSSETLHILKKSKEYSDLTQGAFDVTIGVIKSLWGFHEESPRIPDSSVVRSLLSKVNYREIHFRNDQVFLNQAGMQIDLGGVAKGLIIDRGIEILKEAGIHSGIIEAGGDLRLFGNHPHRTKWRIGIRHPRSDEGELFGVINTDEISIATSGDYERYFMKEGKRYHHILDPTTGFPAEPCVSVTIVAENALMADAFATAVFVLGPDAGMALIERLPSIEGIILYEEGEQLQYRMSESFQQMIELQ